jgi:hypothetical protein
VFLSTFVVELTSFFIAWMTLYFYVHLKTFSPSMDSNKHCTGWQHRFDLSGRTGTNAHTATSGLAHWGGFGLERA